MNNYFDEIKVKINGLNFRIVKESTDTIEYEIDSMEHLRIKKINDNIIYQQGRVNAFGQINAGWNILVDLQNNTEVNNSKINDFVCKLQEKRAVIGQRQSMIKITGKHIYDPYILGTDSRQIYDDGVRRRGFNPDMAGDFGRNKDLFSRNCTPEGYDVWFCKHTQLSGSNINNPSNWFNCVYEDKIFEMVKDSSNMILEKNDRIVYGLAKNGYFYMGKYKYSNIYYNQVYNGVPVTILEYNKVANS